MSGVVYEIENRGKRNFVIALDSHVSGGKVNTGADGKATGVTIEPEQIVKVTEECGKKLAHDWPKEIKILKKSKARKE